MRFWLLFPALLAGCATALPEIPKACLGVAPEPALSGVEGTPAARDATPPRSTAPHRIRVEDGRLLNGDSALAGPFAAIDSFDVSSSRGEVAFSAMRDGSFDIGLVALEGSEVKWVPPDPADEVGVQWAPRGNKISYIVRARGGDLVRTLHVPTSMELAVTFPWARISSLRWDVAAERYTVVYSTPDGSDRTEVARYGGEERGVTVGPASRLDVSIEPLGPDAIVLRPNDLRYEERLPVVIWLDDDLHTWSEARAALIRGARVAVVVTKRDDVFARLAELPWLDTTKMYRVAPEPALSEVEGTSAVLPIAAEVGGATQIIADATVPAGRYRERRGVVAVAPPLVQFFAACYIADQLKRTSPPNGSSR